jgi:hypothetical protein
MPIDSNNMLLQLYKQFPDFVVIADPEDADYEEKYPVYLSLLEHDLIEHDNFDGEYLLKPEDRDNIGPSHSSTLSARLSEKGLSYLKNHKLIEIR